LSPTSTIFKTGVLAILAPLDILTRSTVTKLARFAINETIVSLAEIFLAATAVFNVVFAFVAEPPSTSFTYTDGFFTTGMLAVLNTACITFVSSETINTDLQLASSTLFDFPTVVTEYTSRLAVTIVGSMATISA
jgi:hypothetical protein